MSTTLTPMSYMSALVNLPAIQPKPCIMSDVFIAVSSATAGLTLTRLTDEGVFPSMQQLWFGTSKRTQQASSAGGGVSVVVASPHGTTHECYPKSELLTVVCDGCSRAKPCTYWE